MFGRRGSGKSSLLRKAAADLTVDRRPIAHVDLETFKGHSYPDVLLSVLISTFDEFKKWMDTAAIHPRTRKSFWNSLFGTTPTSPAYSKKDAKKLSDLLESEIKSLTAELHRKDDAELTVRSGTAASETAAAGVAAKAGIANTAVESQLSGEVRQQQN
ncbi:MAG: hypothetical protein HKM95_16980, partial [Inquilinus sp.]|nr:hypothetical protein [Inquilinus sp.]